MNHLFFALTIFCFIHHSLSQQCPSAYLRYSKKHSYCKPKNTQCPIYHSGVRSEEIVQILDLHNKYRSFVATGKEKQGGGLPQASDMIQMVKCSFRCSLLNFIIGEEGHVSNDQIVKSYTNF